MYNKSNIITFFKKVGYEKNFHHGGYTTYKIYFLVPKELDFDGRIQIIKPSSYNFSFSNPNNCFEIETMNIDIPGYDSTKYSLITTPFSTSIGDYEEKNNIILSEKLDEALDKLKDMVLLALNEDLPVYMKKFPYNSISKDLWISERLFYIFPSSTKKTLILKLDNRREINNIVIRKFPKDSPIFPGETLSINSIDPYKVKVSLNWIFKNGKLIEEQIPVYNLVKDFITNLRMTLY